MYIRILAMDLGYTEIERWLEESRHWTPLQHLLTIDIDRARALLHANASIHVGAPTPLSIAERMHAGGTATEGSAAALVLAAGHVWSPSTHAFFPPVVRVLAVRVMLIGAQLYQHDASVPFSGLPFELWLHNVMARLITWDCA